VEAIDDSLAGRKSRYLCNPEVVRGT